MALAGGRVLDADYCFAAALLLIREEATEWMLHEQDGVGSKWSHALQDYAAIFHNYVKDKSGLVVA